MASKNPIVANAMAAHGVARNAYCEAGDYIETRDGGQETVKRVVGDKVYIKSGEVIRMSDVKAVLNAVARNSVEVEVSLMYAGRVQHAMRDAARAVSGVRITGSNTLYCPNDDAADEVVDILEQAGVPKREISLNAKRVARNAGAYDVAAQAGNLFKDAYNALAGCAANLERLTTLGQPNDVPGNDNKIASWAKDKARKVRDIMNKLDQGRL